MKLSIEERIIISLIVLRPLITLLDSSISGVGIISMIILDIGLGVYIFRNLWSKKKWILIVFSLIIGVISIYCSSNFFVGIRDTSKFISLMFIIIVSSSYKFMNRFIEFVIKYKNMIAVEIYLIGGITLFQILFSRYYQITYGEKIFVGGYDHPHTLAYSMILLIAISILLYRLNSSKIIYLVISISFIAIAFSGARTAIIVAILLFIALNNKFLYIIKFISISAIGVLIIGVNNIPFINKFIISSNMGMITSGRDIVWKLDINYFKSSEILNKLVGNGANFPYEFHQFTIGQPIWAHNDFINILVVMGVVGLIIYISLILSYTINIYKHKNLIRAILIFISMIAIASGNGLYMYIDFVITLIFIMAIFHIDKYKNYNKKVNN